MCRPVPYTVKLVIFRNVGKVRVLIAALRAACRRVRIEALRAALCRLRRFVDLFAHFIELLRQLFLTVLDEIDVLAFERLFQRVDLFGQRVLSSAGNLSPSSEMSFSHW